MSEPMPSLDLLAGLELADEQATPLVTYCEGSEIFSEGDPGSMVYLVESGAVRISKHIEGRNQVVAELGPGELLGEMAVIDDSVRSATAIALQDTELVPISRRQLGRAFQSADPLLQLVMQELAKRLRSGNGQPAQLEPIAASSRTKTRQNAIESIHVQRDLGNALKRGELVLYYQPVVEMPSGTLLGFEALIRWLHPERGLVPPIKFIDIAESSGLVVPIGLWVLKQACHTISRMRALAQRYDSAARPLFMGVNVSPRQIRSPNDVKDMVQALEDAQLEPGTIKLEVTEQAMVQDPVSAEAALVQLKKTGAHVAIDDFGTGYSSLSYLNRFPLDVLKLDRSFVSKMVEDVNTLRIVRAVCGLALDMSLDIVAEGIESQDEVDQLVELGCKRAQGYLYSKPLPEQDAFEYVRKQASLHAGAGNKIRGLV